MFTGLVEGLGTIVAIERKDSAIDVTIEPGDALADRDSTAIGDSVSINGCCLTVIAISESGWTFQAGAETLSRTNLGQLTSGSFVNLERSLRPTDRLGGHFVQGHVDDQGTVERIEQDGEWTTMWFQVPERLTRQMVSKGSITVDGVSLTLVEVTSNSFSVALIPHTLQVTTLGRLRVGDPVNIETDIIGKYLEKLLSNVQPRT
ncbi:MAG: riboflavin synthase [Planctomycetaceae bacterium]|nr:riboflavin synthase [Planctomycetaceae bacterium]